MDRLSSGTLPIIDYGGDQAIRLYAMWTILAFQHAPASPPLVSTALRALSALVSSWYRLSDGDGWVLSLAVKIRGIRVSRKVGRGDGEGR